MLVRWVANLLFWVAIVVVVFWGCHTLLAEAAMLISRNIGEPYSLAEACVIATSLLLTILFLGVVIFFVGSRS